MITTLRSFIARLRGGAVLLVLAGLSFSAMPGAAQIPTSGLQLWLRASDLAHLPSATRVGVWPDVSGGGRDAVSEGTNRPLLLNSFLNGQSVVRFNGTTGYGSIGTHLDAPVATGSAVTAFVVAANRRSTLTRDAVDIVLSTKGSGSNPGFGFTTYNSFSDPTYSFRALTAEPAGSGSSVMLRKNGSASTAVTLNEFAVLTYLGSGIVNGAGSGDSLRIGGFTDQTTGFYGQHDIAEVLVYNRRLSSPEVLAVEAALAEKYGLLNHAEPVLTGSARPYRGAEVRTVGTFTYGRFEVRMRSMPVSGVLASFFTYAEVSADRWNEIDLEIMGRYGNEVQFNAITPGPAHHVHRQVVDFNPHAQYHDYAFEWTPDYVAWFVDGVEAHRQTGAHVETLQLPQKLMMNVWQPIYLDWAGPFDAAELPECAFYDRVSYASYTPDSGSAGTGNNFTPQWSDEFETFNTSRWSRATHTFEGNNVQFATQNAVVDDGSLVLCITRPDRLGYTPTAAEDEVDVSGAIRVWSYPNPFRTHTVIRYMLEAPAEVRLAVYDALGREVARLQDGAVLPAGQHEAAFDSGSLPPGLYVYRLSAGSDLRTGRMMLIR